VQRLTNLFRQVKVCNIVCIAAKEHYLLFL
jgi:hypothetical protein